MRKPLAIWNNAQDVWEKTGEKVTPNLLCGHSGVYSETLPASGIALNGVLYGHQTLGNRTAEKECLSLHGAMTCTHTKTNHKKKD